MWRNVQNIARECAGVNSTRCKEYVHMAWECHYFCGYLLGHKTTVLHKVGILTWCWHEMRNVKGSPKLCRHVSKSHNIVIIKRIGIHPLGIMHVCCKFHGNQANTCFVFQSSVKVVDLMTCMATHRPMMLGWWKKNHWN